MTESTPSDATPKRHSLLSAQRIALLAPGQFWIVVLIGVSLAGFAAYRYLAIPQEQERESEALAKALAVLDSSSSELRIANIQGGMSLHSADSVYAADQMRHLGMAIRQANRRIDEDSLRPVYLVFSFAVLAVITRIAWVWFGRQHREEHT